MNWRWTIISPLSKNPIPLLLPLLYLGFNYHLWGKNKIHPPNLQKFLKQLQAPSPQKQLQALQYLSLHQPQNPTLQKYLPKLLQSKHPQIQLTTLTTLSKMGPTAAYCLPQLLPLLQHPSPSIQMMTTYTLGKISTPAIPYLWKLLPSPTPQGHYAKIAFEYMGKSAIPFLQQHWHSAPPLARARTIAILAHYPKLTQKQLLLALHDPHPFVRKQAILSLSPLLHKPPTSLLQQLQNTLQSPSSPYAKCATIELLSYHPNLCQYTLPTLIQQLQSPHLNVKLSTIQALIQLKKYSQTALPTLKKLTQHPNPILQNAAKNAIKIIQPKPTQKNIQPPKPNLHTKPNQKS